jgi:hypothetical protein
MKRQSLSDLRDCFSISSPQHDAHEKIKKNRRQRGNWNFDFVLHEIKLTVRSNEKPLSGILFIAIYIQ